MVKTITARGIGQPDWYRSVQSTRPKLSPGQSRGYWTASGNILANSYSIIDVGTVPSGEQWVIGFVSVSCSKSGINLIILTTDEFGFDYEFFGSYYDVNLQVPFSTLGAFPVGSGGTLKVHLYNYLPETAYFRVAVHYTVNKV